MSEYDEQIKEKIIVFFNTTKCLNFENLIEFIKQVDISYIFDTQENIEILWKEITNQAGNSEIKPEHCVKAIDTIFNTYSNPQEENLENNRITISQKMSEASSPKQKRKKFRNEIEGLTLNQLREIAKVFQYTSQVEKIFKSELLQFLNEQGISLSIEKIIFFLNFQSPNLDENSGIIYIDEHHNNKYLAKIEDKIHEMEMGGDIYDLSKDFNRLDEKPINETFEDISNIDVELTDSAMIMSDIIQQIQSKIFVDLKTNIIEIKEKSAIQNDYINSLLNFSDVMSKRIKDLDYFITSINKSCIIKNRKNEYFRELLIKKDNLIMRLEQEVQASNLAIERGKDHEIIEKLDEKIVQENEQLIQQIDEKNRIIQEKQKELQMKDHYSLELTDKLDYLRKQFNKALIENEEISKKNKSLQSDYDLLISSIFEKQNRKPDNEKELKRKKEILNNPQFTEIKKDKEISEKINSIMELEYEALLKYTLNSEIMNKNFETTNSSLKNTIYELESQLRNLNEKRKDDSHLINDLKNEKIKLSLALDDLSKKHEIDSKFRPSHILSKQPRASNVSKDKQNFQKQNLSLEDLRISHIESNLNDINKNYNNLEFQGNFKKQKISSEESDNEFQQIGGKFDSVIGKKSKNCLEIEKIEEFNFVSKSADKPFEIMNVEDLESKTNNEEHETIEILLKESIKNIVIDEVNEKKNEKIEVNNEINTKINENNNSSNPEYLTKTIDGELYEINESSLIHGGKLNLNRNITLDSGNLLKEQNIVKQLKNHKQVNLAEMFTLKIKIFNYYFEKLEKILVIDEFNIYLLDPMIFKLGMTYERNMLSSVLVSNKDKNLLLFQFKDPSIDNILIETTFRVKLIYYLRHLYEIKNFITLPISYSDSFILKRELMFNFVVLGLAQYNISVNFDASLKSGYLQKWGSGIIFGSFKLKMVSLCSNGFLYYFDSPKDMKPKRKVKIIGSRIQKIFDDKYKRKFCFSISDTERKNIIFAAEDEEDLNGWLNILEKLKKDYEEIKKQKIVYNQK